jgi:acyl-CoA thioester hydrolase
MQTQGFGPILFREECVFRKEIKLGDTIFMHTKSSKVNADASRWSIVHEFRNDKNQLCATITVDGAWMDLKLRKLAAQLLKLLWKRLSFS